MKSRLSVAVIIALIFGLTAGCATISSLRGKAKAAPEPLSITAIDFQEDAVRIEANGQFTYTLYKPADPYKVVVELPGVKAGAFEGKHDSKTPGVAELTVTGVQEPMDAVRVEMLLETPSEVKASYVDNALTITVMSDDMAFNEGAAADSSDTIQIGRVEPGRMQEERRQIDIPVLEESAADAMAASAPPRPVIEIKEAEPGVSAPKNLSPARVITGIEFEQSGGAQRLVITADGAMYPNIFSLGNRVVIDIPGVKRKAPLPETITSPVKAIRAGTYEDMERLVVDLDGDFDFEATAVDNTVVVELTEKRSSDWEVVSSEDPEEEAARAAGVEGYGKKYTGQVISLDFQKADIEPLFWLLGDLGGFNIVIHPGVKGTITLKLKDVPWDQALDILLETFRLDKSIEGNIMKIMPITEFTRLKEDERKLLQSSELSEPLVQDVIPINYAQAGKIKAAIKEAKIDSTRGSITIDDRMNTLIVKDTQGSIDNIHKLIKIMDVPKSQVMIEAKIVEISSNYTEDLGIRWGGNVRPRGWPVTGGTFGINNPSVSLNSPVEIPTGGGVDGGGFLGLTLGTANTFQVQMTLSALETTNRSRTLSNPKILTMDKETANIQQGDSIPIQTTTAEGTSTVFVNANLNLQVTPQITPEGYVLLDIQANNDRAQIMAGGSLGIRKQGLKTKALVKDGDTLVIGGIYTNTETVSETSVPWLGSIPGLGWLFKTKSKQGPTRTELLILITPKIVKRIK